MKTRQGFHEYKKANLHMRHGQAFCNYFEYQDTDNVLFTAHDKDANVFLLTKQLMDNWQTPFV